MYMFGQGATQPLVDRVIDRVHKSSASLTVVEKKIIRLYWEGKQKTFRVSVQTERLC